MHERLAALVRCAAEEPDAMVAKAYNVRYPGEGVDNEYEMIVADTLSVGPMLWDAQRLLNGDMDRVTSVEGTTVISATFRSAINAAFNEDAMMVYAHFAILVEQLMQMPRPSSDAGGQPIRVHVARTDSAPFRTVLDARRWDASDQTPVRVEVTDWTIVLGAKALADPRPCVLDAWVPGSGGDGSTGALWIYPERFTATATEVRLVAEGLAVPKERPVAVWMHYLSIGIQPGGARATLHVLECVYEALTVAAGEDRLMQALNSAAWDALASIGVERDEP